MLKKSKKGPLKASDQMFGVDLMCGSELSYVVYLGERFIVHPYTMRRMRLKKGQLVSRKVARFLDIEFASIVDTRQILEKIFKNKNNEEKIFIKFMEKTFGEKVDF